MSIEYGHLCSAIIKQCFGEVVQIVADCLFKATARSLANIVKSTKQSRREVIAALTILIKFQLVSFKISDSISTCIEYSIKREEILFIMRYSKYVHLMQTKYGTIGAAIVEDLLQSGPQSGSNILYDCFSSPDNKDDLDTLRDTFYTMIKNTYLIKLSHHVQNQISETNVAPSTDYDTYDLFTLPEIDLKAIKRKQSGLNFHFKDADILWQLNFSRFHQDFRDSIMISAIDKRLGPSPGECFKYILIQMYERTDPWQKRFSNPFTYAEIKQSVEKKSNNLELIKYLDQYITLIADDSLGFLRKVGEMGGGQYVVDMEIAFEQLSLACIENVIKERFGCKASRIFRVIRMKKYIEQEDIQKEAMIPAKEAKFLVYNLTQEQLIQIKTIRKGGGGGTGPAKAFYLFHLKQKQIVKMLLGISFKALHNSIVRSSFEKCENKRLIEKSQKLDSIVQTMKDRGESEEYIAEILETLTPPEREILEKIKLRMKSLSRAELFIDDTIFLLQMNLYHTSIPVSSSLKKKPA